MKKFLKLLLVLFLLLIYMYVLVWQNLPDELVLFEVEKVNLKTILGINISENVETLQASSNDIGQQDETVRKTNLEVSLFNDLLVKEINVDILEKATVIPVGNIAGVKLYTSGILVVGMSEIEGADNKRYKPYENTGIEEGDRITKVDEVEVASTDELTKEVNESKGAKISLTFIHDEETKTCSIEPVKTENDEYKLGLWVRDSAAGVGTVTFYDPDSKTFGALGHGITDIDTNELINIASGEFVTTKILNLKKGESGNPGKIQGTIENQKNIGTIYKNSKFGIYGKVEDLSSLGVDASKEMEIALRDEIKEGKATILCSLDNKAPKEYEIEIEKVYRENNYDNKSMLIKVTDEELLEKTGGIIQGMSGSPIIQNGKFVGAVTHVLVNNPDEGYGVFGDIMYKQSKIVE